MLRISRLLAVILSFLMIGPIGPRTASAALADRQSLVTQSQIEDALLRRSANEEKSRDALRNVLARQDVRRMAKDFGIDVLTVDKAAGLVGTLEGKDLERAAASANELNERLAGGDVTISIGLISLLLIIIII